MQFLFRRKKNVFEVKKIEMKKERKKKTKKKEKTLVDWYQQSQKNTLLTTARGNEQDAFVFADRIRIEI